MSAREGDAVEYGGWGGGQFRGVVASVLPSHLGLGWYRVAAESGKTHTVPSDRILSINGIPVLA